MKKQKAQFSKHTVETRSAWICATHRSTQAAIKQALKPTEEAVKQWSAPLEGGEKKAVFGQYEQV